MKSNIHETQNFFTLRTKQDYTKSLAISESALKIKMISICCCSSFKIVASYRAVWIRIVCYPGHYMVAALQF